MLASSGNAPEPLLTTGPLVSPILRDATWDLELRPWTAESRLLLYTDGIPETWGDGEQMFEVERLRAAFMAGDASGSELLARVHEAVDRFAGGRPSADDKTLLTARQIG